MLKLHNIQFIMPEIQLYFHDIFISLFVQTWEIKEDDTVVPNEAMDHEMQLDTVLSLIDSLQDYNMHGNAFCPFCRCLLQKWSFLFLLLYHSCYYSCKPLLAVFIIVPKLTNYSANLTVFRDVMTRPPLEDMLCVDLSYLIFRTCLALIKAMMVCMAKDLLVYTAAMAVGVINRKVIYMLAILFIECCFWTIDSLPDRG